MVNKINNARQKRKKRVRSKIKNKTQFLRLSVFRSNKYIYAQVIDDKKGETIVSENDIKFKDEKMNKTAKAQKVGKKLAQKILELNIKQVVFDRGAYKYNGRIKVLAEAVRKAGVII